MEEIELNILRLLYEAENSGRSSKNSDVIAQSLEIPYQDTLDFMRLRLADHLCHNHYRSSLIYL